MSGRAALTVASLMMALAVAAGAFGAHALRGRLDDAMIGVWHTAVQYHAWHALGLAAVGLYALHAPGRGGLDAAAWLFVAGIALFSGSLYLLALTEARWLGAITPIGGAAFIAGWLALAWAASR